MDLKLTSMFKTCVDSSLGKAKKNGFKKTVSSQSTIKGQRLYIDISLPFIAIKYVLDMRNLGFEIEPNGNKKEPWMLFVLAIVTIQTIQLEEV